MVPCWLQPTVVVVAVLVLLAVAICYAGGSWS